jgi:hypothetical protein
MSTESDSQAPHAAAARLKPCVLEEARHHRLLGRFPGEADADIDRLHVARCGFLRQQHRAVQPARKEHRCGHWVIW